MVTAAIKLWEYKAFKMGATCTAIGIVRPGHSTRAAMPESVDFVKNLMVGVVPAVC